MTLDERTRWYFLSGVGLRPDEVPGLRVLDAGCGNGSSTLGIARLGALCVGIDLSTGLEKVSDYFTESDRGLAALYVQCNLIDAPFEPGTFDVVFSAGVLHHTTDTRQAFIGACAPGEAGRPVLCLALPPRESRDADCEHTARAHDEAPTPDVSRTGAGHGSSLPVVHLDDGRDGHAAVPGSVTSENSRSWTQPWIFSRPNSPDSPT